MIDFIYRTEELKSDEILKYFVETKEDRSYLEALKGRNPVVLVGGRGVGKSFLLRVAENELLSKFEIDRILPIYVTFNKSSLICAKGQNQFQHWMLARICTNIIRTLKKMGLLSVRPGSLSILTGDTNTGNQTENSKIEKIAKAFEDSYKNPGVAIDIKGLPTVEDFKDAIEDLSIELKIDRFIILIDEAAHIFLPQQQRDFFTLFRDLRSPYITCNAAVYPGVTYFGETFQPSHDANMLTLNRNIMSNEYLKNMREIVEKQADSTVIRDIERNGENFNVLAYASSGNPRILLKTLSRAIKVNSNEVNKTIREFYRTEIWSEHSGLSEKYVGHRKLIDWGRTFIEEKVLPELQNKNKKYIEDRRKTSCFFWIHRDAPQVVKEALRILAYTGIVSEHSPGIKGSRSEIGTRYLVNLGCLFALEAVPTATAFQIGKNLNIKLMTEYGVNHAYYQDLLSNVPNFKEIDMSDNLKEQLSKSINVLDITDWQKQKLIELELDTIGKVLSEKEAKLREAYYVGEIRSRRMRNAAIASVYEYLSG
jgi:hypothetical protein